MHSTDDLDDGYFGSGKIITASIKKHGKEKHTKEILEFLPSREALKLREKELVNEELLGDKLCLNLRLGGEGGGGFSSEEHRVKFISSSRTASLKGTLKAKQIALKARETMRRRGTETFPPRCDWTGKKHSAETIIKMSKTMSMRHQGEKNPSYGTCWVTNGIESIKIKKDDLSVYLSNGYKAGRIIKGTR
jgi:hypothetical protein